jgi:hypothetical protein
MLARKVCSYSAALALVAVPVYGYRLPGDPVSTGAGVQLDELSLELSGEGLEERLIQHGNDAATLKYQYRQLSGIDLSTSYSNRLEDPFVDPGGLNIDGYWGLQMKAPAAGGMPGVKFDYSVGGFDGNTGSDFDDSEHRRITVKTWGKLAGFDYGASYNLTGSRFDVVDERKERVRDQDRDREVMMSWIGKTLGRLHVTQFVEQTQRNVDQENRPEVHDSLVGSSLQLTLAKWPYVGTKVSYASGIRERRDLASGRDTIQDLTSIRTSINASHNTWSLNATASRTSPELERGNDFGQPESTIFYIGGSYYPNQQFSITPYWSQSLESYRQWGVESENESKAVTAVYRPTNTNYWLNLYVSHDSRENRDWGVDADYFYSQASVEWRVGDRKSSSNLVSLALGYSRYDDELYSAANEDEFSVRMTFTTYFLDDLLRGRNRFRHDNYTFLNGLSATPFDTPESAVPGF